MISSTGTGERGDSDRLGSRTPQLNTAGTGARTSFLFAVDTTSKRQIYPVSTQQQSDDEDYSQ